MTANPDTLNTERRVPSFIDSLVFRAKTALLQDKTLQRHPYASELANMPIIATSRTPLWTEIHPAERALVAGKIHNLRLAARRLDGIEIPAGREFSFWKQVGRASRLRGFVAGRELREGCIIPSVGGGLCQLSNALYDAALQSNLEILERHQHSQIIAGSLAERGRDATVFWNYIDLKFRVDKPLRIEARLDSKDLIVRFRSEKASEQQPVHQITRKVIYFDQPNSCATCETDDCHRVIRKDPRAAKFGRTAYLVDEFTPEFDRYISSSRTAHDLMFMPLNGRRFRKTNYAWSTNGFQRVRQSIFVTAKRSYSSRKLAAQGAARQRNLLRMYEELAESYADRLSYDVLHVVVHQNLLPFLWMKGHLDGRTFDVLMTALPIDDIHDRLDIARTLNPSSRTLGDFRADPRLAAAEREALRNARKLVTPHTEIANMFASRAEVLEWDRPRSALQIRVTNEKPTIVFPASTVGRKGCYELRDALRGLDVRLILLGPTIEASNFWDGFDTEQGWSDWLERGDVVVLPAYVEHKPRRLLMAVAAGIPVVATPACGVTGVAGVEIVAAGDPVELRTSILGALNRSSVAV
jgi:hypothetical protein